MIYLAFIPISTILNSFNCLISEFYVFYNFIKTSFAKQLDGKYKYLYAENMPPLVPLGSTSSILLISLNSIVIDAGDGIPFKPRLTTADLAGSGSKRTSPEK